MLKYLKYIKNICMWLGKGFVKVYPYLAMLFVLFGLYFNIQTLVIIGAIISIHLIIAFITRDKTRPICYNYFLANNWHLPRLTRDDKLTIYEHEDRYTFVSSKYNSTNTLTKRDVPSWLFWISFLGGWIWFGDNSDSDLTVENYADDIIVERKHFDWVPSWLGFHWEIQREWDYIKTQPKGTAFHLAEGRTKVSIFKTPLMSLLWQIRNTSYNYGYYFEEKAEGDKDFYYYHTKRKYPMPTINKWNSIPYIWYNMSYMHFGFMPYENSERQGRAVIFTEDIDRVDDEVRNRFIK